MYGQPTSTPEKPQNSSLRKNSWDQTPITYDCESSTPRRHRDTYRKDPTKGEIMYKRIVPFTLALLLIAGCSSSDPTASDDYAALEQELAQTEAQLNEIVAERDALIEEFTATAIAFDATAAMVAPDRVAAVIDDWYEALDRGDDSVLDLYVPQGYHLYGDKRIEYDEIVSHLTGGSIEHVWITEPLLITDEGDGRYVAVRGMRNTMPGAWENATAISFEIVTTPDGALKLVQTAWFYDNEWSAG
jgi:hypothetical protein